MIFVNLYLSIRHILCLEFLKSISLRLIIRMKFLSTDDKTWVEANKYKLIAINAELITKKKTTFKLNKT